MSLAEAPTLLAPVSGDAPTLAQTSSPGVIHPEPAPLVEADPKERYEAKDMLGKGGMGEVRLFRDRRIGRDIARKVIRAEHAANAEVRARFEREARVQAQLEHPAVVPVYDLGIGPAGEVFFTMKRVRGMSLEDVLAGLRARDGAIAATHSRRRLLTALSSVCLAVAFAHVRGVVHRDLKPANIMLGEFGEVNVLDWGLAKIAGVADLAPTPGAAVDLERAGDGASPGYATAAGSILGTPGYMAPEQARGDVAHLDGRVDVYALGAILFEIVTLHPLHEGPSLGALFASTIREDACSARLEELRRRGAIDDVPPEIEAIIARATALDPDRRHATAREVSDAIERFLDGDRDLERRRELSLAHTAAAEEAAASAADPGGDPIAARARAMREVNLALALDPQNRAALGTMVRLLASVPESLPPEAEAELTAASARELRRGSREAAAGYLLWLVIGPMLLLLGVRSFGGAMALTALVLVAAAHAWWEGTSSGRIPLWRVVIGILMAGVLVGGLRELFGPFIGVPSIAAVITMVWVLNLGPRRTPRFIAIASGVLSVTLPAVLELAGALPRSTVVESGVVRILPQMVSYPTTGTFLYLVVSSGAVILVAGLLAARIVDALNRAERRVFAHAWQLRQLVPDAAHAATTSDGTVATRAQESAQLGHE